MSSNSNTANCGFGQRGDARAGVVAGASLHSGTSKKEMWNYQTKMKIRLMHDSLNSVGRCNPRAGAS
jgi:hypothetical protein